MKEHTLGVALVKEACQLCGKTEDGPIILNTHLTEKNAKEVEEMNGKVIGYMKGPCKECKELMKQGFLLIGYIEEKTDDKTNPYRSGNQWVIKREAAEEMFADCSKGAAFIDMKAAEQIGLPIK